jgi:hypothetical protein
VEIDVLIVRRLRERKVTPLSRYYLAIFQNQKVTTGILVEMRGISRTQLASSTNLPAPGADASRTRNSCGVRYAACYRSTLARPGR